MNARRNLYLAVRGLGHTSLRIFVNSERHACRAVALEQRADFIDPLLTVFQVDAVDNAASTSALQRRFNHICLGAVHHQWRIHMLHVATRHLGHVLHAIASNKVNAHIQEVTAIAHLFFRHADQAIPVIGVQQRLELLASVGIGALCNDQETIVLPELGESIEA